MRKNALVNQDQKQVEDDMMQCVKELMEICTENPDLVYLIGCTLLKMGGIPRNYIIKQERKAVSA